MKKSFVFAAVAAVALASCTNDESSIKMTDKLGQSEVAIYPFSKTATRGFVTGNEFFEWKLNDLRDDVGKVKPIKDSPAAETSGDERAMQLSVYNEMGECDLFIGKEFTRGVDVLQKGDEAPITTDSIWRANPPIYYPIGYADFDFLAYSLGEKKPSATWNGAKEVTLEVTKDCLTDDILYAGGVQNAKAHAAAPMLFGHAQAWLTTRFTLDENSIEDVLKINKVTWQDVYASGELNIKFNKTTDEYKADATWNFFTQETSNVEMPDRSTDGKKTYGANVTKEDALTQTNYLDMLIPAQPKQSFVIEYTLGEGVGAQTYEYTVDNDDLTDGDWKMGTHYIYNIQFSITEITTAPTVKIWAEQEVKFGEPAKQPLEL